MSGEKETVKQEKTTDATSSKMSEDKHAPQPTSPKKARSKSSKADKNDGSALPVAPKRVKRKTCAVAADKEDQENIADLGQSDHDINKEDNEGKSAKSGKGKKKARAGKVRVQERDLTAPSVIDQFIGPEFLQKRIPVPGPVKSSSGNTVKPEKLQQQDENMDWWWEFVGDRIPPESLPKDWNPKWLFLCISIFTVHTFPVILLLVATISRSFYGSEKLTLLPTAYPLTISIKTEYVLRDRRPKLSGYDSQYVVNVDYRHPDPARRSDPTLTVDDFPEDEKYEALFANALQMSRQDAQTLPGLRQKSVTTAHIIVAHGRDGTSCEFPSECSQLLIAKEKYVKVLITSGEYGSSFMTLGYYLAPEELADALAQGASMRPFEETCIASLWQRLQLLRKPAKFSIPDTMGGEEMELPPGFGLELRSYQKRTLKWLVELEADVNRRTLKVEHLNRRYIEAESYLSPPSKVLQLGPNGAFVDLSTGKVVQHFPSLPPPSMIKVQCDGAILADDTGTGKTVTVLALVHANPFTTASAVAALSRFSRSSIIPSRATLVVCPSHLVAQWKLEAKRCLPHGKIHSLSTIHDYRNLSWNDVLLADVIITSLHFLQNKSYMEYIGASRGKHCGGIGHWVPETKELHEIGRGEFGPAKGEVVLSQVFWHRIVCDEFHELGKNKRVFMATDVFKKELKSAFIVGVTGTPQYKAAWEIADMARYLGTELPNYRNLNYAFLDNLVRRNEPNLQLPPLTQRVIKVELTPQERGMYHSFRSLTVESLMSCNHHQLATDIVRMVGGKKEMTVDEVAVAVQEKRWNQIQQLTASIARAEKSGPDAGGVVAQRTKLASLRSQFNFFQAVLNALRADQEQNCLICLETIAEEEEFAIARCGHIHCVGCMEMLLARNPCCSLCRTPMKRSDVMYMKLPKHATVKDKQDDANNCMKYGSKLAAFVRFLRETLRERPDAKFILFIQFRRLMHLVSDALREFEVEHVRCDGNVFSKTKAVTGFKTSPDVRLILLSSEESVSGLHLTEATHVVIFHPFYLGDDALAMAYEKQGIARAWRGGLEHPVEVVRFIAQGTIEEALANCRGYGDNKGKEKEEEKEEEKEKEGEDAAGANVMAE